MTLVTVTLWLISLRQVGVFTSYKMSKGIKSILFIDIYLSIHKYIDMLTTKRYLRGLKKNKKTRASSENMRMSYGWQPQISSAIQKKRAIKESHEAKEFCDLTNFIFGRTEFLDLPKFLLKTQISTGHWRPFLRPSSIIRL